MEKIEKIDYYQKMGINSVKPFKKNGRWVFKADNGMVYDMAPAQATEAILDPLVIGADRLIAVGCKLKGIKNPESGFLLLFSKDYFPNADVKFNLSEPKFTGWVYTVEELNLKGIPVGQAAWVCPYITQFYSQPPQSVYLRIEELES
jgi:hypothetical protein